MKNFAIAATLLALTLSACATTEKVNAVQTADVDMTCIQLSDEIARLTIVKAQASDRSMNGTNIAATIDSNRTERMATERHAHLSTFYREKQCGNSANAALAIEAPSFLLDPVATGE